LLNSLAYFGCDDIPVASGAQTILSATGVLSKKLTELANDLWGIEIPNSNKESIKARAPEAICQTLHAATEPVKILAIAPLTNIAIALVLSPSIAEKISAIYLTGGNPNQQNNDAIYAGNERYDIVATRIVYNSKIPIYSMPNPTCELCPVNDPLLDRLNTEKLRGPENYIRSLLKYPQESESCHQLYMWDVLTAFVAYYELKYAEVTQEHVDIDETTKHKSELIYEYQTGLTLNLITNINKQIFFKLFLDTIFDE
jgi:inosine-uridine nucleoside N-ribohydrolase